MSRTNSNVVKILALEILVQFGQPQTPSFLREFFALFSLICNNLWQSLVLQMFFPVGPISTAKNTAVIDHVQEQLSGRVASSVALFTFSIAKMANLMIYCSFTNLPSHRYFDTECICKMFTDTIQYPFVITPASL